MIEAEIPEHALRDEARQRTPAIKEQTGLGGCVMESIDDQPRTVRGILLLEDSPGETELFCRALHDAEYCFEGFRLPQPIPLTTTLTANHALTWLTRAAEQEQAVLPVLVIADVNLPGHSGQRFFRHVRNDPRLCHLPIIMMMWAAEDQAGLTVGGGGPVDFMIKPLRFDELVEHLHNILKRWFRHTSLL